MLSTDGPARSDLSSCDIHFSRSTRATSPVAFSCASGPGALTGHARGGPRAVRSARASRGRSSPAPLPPLPPVARLSSSTISSASPGIPCGRSCAADSASASAPSLDEWRTACVSSSMGCSAGTSGQRRSTPVSPVSTTARPSSPRLRAGAAARAAWAAIRDDGRASRRRGHRRRHGAGSPAGPPTELVDVRAARGRPTLTGTATGVRVDGAHRHVRVSRLERRHRALARVDSAAGARGRPSGARRSRRHGRARRRPTRPVAVARDPPLGPDRPDVARRR